MEIISPTSEETLNFGISIPKPFRLEDQSKEDLDKIKEEVMDKTVTWERRMSTFFDAFFIAQDSWRIKPRAKKGRDSKTLFDSKSGETHRATDTLATVWQRMLTAADPYFEVVAMGLSPNGQPLTESDLFNAEAVLIRQMEISRYRDKLLTVLQSIALLGTGIVEEPYVSLPYGFGRKSIEFTDFNFRSLLLTGFDTAVSDINDSDFIITVDFISKWMLRNIASQDTEHYDINKVEAHIEEFGKGVPNSLTDVYTRLQQSRSRAGYYDQDAKVFENLNYHGRLETNDVMSAFAESIGLDQDPKYVDWSVGVLDGTDVCKFHMTQYGDWRTRFKVATYKHFENEPLGYGIGQIGRKLQRQMDVMESLTDDRFMFDILNMMKIGKYSGYSAKQFVAEPMKMIELEDVNQLVPLVGDPRVLQQALAMIGMRREDFRNIVGAKTNLQAEISKASATESAIASTEAIRSAGVHAEIIGEPLVRGHLEQSHLNNLNYLDEGIWVGMTGSRAPMQVTKNQLPINVGFKMKIVTDKDFRPERIKNLLQVIQIATSIRNLMPSSINVIKSAWQELYRSLGMNPRMLDEQMPIADMLEMKAARMAASGGGMGNEVAGEMADEGSGAMHVEDTPMGPVPTSPLGSSSMDMSA